MLKNTLTVLRGTVAAQAIGFLALPLLTRLYTPEAFGLFQLYQSGLALLLVAATMRFEIALLRATDGEELRAVFQLCLLVNAVLTVVAALGCGIAWWLPDALSATTRQVIWYFPIGVLVGGCLQMLGYLALRQQAFGPAATAKMAQAGGYVTASVGIGLISAVPSGLVVADLLGRLASALTIVAHRAVFDARLLRRAPAAALRAAAHKFREFPLVSVPGGLINAAGGVATSLLMYGAFDAAVSGQYGLVERSLMLPVGMVAAAVSQVFTADLSASLREGGARALGLFHGVLRRMFLLAIGPAVLVGLFAPWAFGHLFGPNWVLAGEFSRIMAPLLLVVAVTTPVNMAIMILGWQKVQLGWEVARLCVVLLAWWCVIHFDMTPQSAVAMHVAANVMTNLLYLWLADHMLRRHATPGPLAPAAVQP